MTLSEGEQIQASDLDLPEPRTGQKEEGSPADLENYLDLQEKEVILQALEKTRYNKTAAAKLLGITFRALRYRLKKLGIE
jgi:two-component system response regulator PilR (NtrC family)